MRATLVTGKPGGGGEAGFTLLEMLVVVGILGLLTTLAFPTVRPVLSLLAVQSAQSDLVSNLRSVRAEAMREDAPMTIEISRTARGYTWNGRRIELPSGARLLADRASVSFSGEGTSSGGHFAIAWNGRMLDVEVDPDTGLAKWELPGLRRSY